MGSALLTTLSSVERACRTGKLDPYDWVSLLRQGYGAQGDPAPPSTPVRDTRETPQLFPLFPGWLGPAGIRVLTWWPVKLAGTALGMTLFFTVYFWVLAHPLAPVTIMPVTAVDRLIGFQPAALPLYLSLWVYVSLAPALVVKRRELASFGLAWVALSVIGLGIFLCWPTAVQQAGVDWSQYPRFDFLKSVDAAGNACPSLHVAFAVFSAVWLGRSLSELGAGRVMRGLNWLWCLGILWSTMATGQHVFLDVLGGSVLGALVAAGHLRWLRKAG